MQVATGGSDVYVQRLQEGITEVQTITLASDVQDVREVQQFFVPASTSSLSLSFASQRWVDVSSLTNTGRYHTSILHNTPHYTIQHYTTLHYTIQHYHINNPSTHKHIF